jgi:hypothetical protein
MKTTIAVFAVLSVAVIALAQWDSQPPNTRTLPATPSAQVADVSTITADHAVTGTDRFILVGTNYVTVTLPDTAAIGREVTVKNARGFGTTYIACTHSEIDGAHGTFTLTNSLDTVTAFSDGTNWWLTSAFFH